MKKTKEYAMEMSEQSLYQIQEEHLDLIMSIESLDGEITPEIDELMTINKEHLQIKSMSYIGVISNKELQNELLTNEIKRLMAIKKRNTSSIDYLKSRLLSAVKLFGSYEVGFTKFGTRKSSAVIVDDVNSLPKEFKVVKITEQADKKAIKEALTSGKEIEGCRIQENFNLKIN